MTKCDVIIPVYKAPEWVQLCVYSLFTNTDKKTLGRVFLINDCDDTFTINCLQNLKEKYGSKITIKQNSKNLGFVKTVNYGLSLSSADYVMLLNTDCIISKNTIEKLMTKMNADKRIGLICPLSNNAANLSLEMPEGFTFTQMDSLLESKFSGESFNACTIVGNCLMISRECLEKVGKLDEAYGTGYGEETDYQFKAMRKGFSAKVAIDTYVFHKSEISFGRSKEKQARLQKNRELFFSRWQKEYDAELKKFEANNPIEYIRKNLTKEDLTPKADTLFYIDGIVQNAGGVHVVVDIVNYLVINGYLANILFNLQYPYKEIMLFAPIDVKHVNKVNTKQIVSTIWKTAFLARKIADSKNIRLISFIQGYEAYFEGGNIYGGVETSYKLADSMLTISQYLKNELQTVFGRDADVISNGINYDLVHISNKNIRLNDTTRIAVILRNNTMKGDWILLDVIKKLSLIDEKITLNIVAMNEKTLFPNISANKSVHTNYFKGPLDRSKIYEILQRSDFYIDASLSEGFGLTALEAMAAGCIPIVSNSLGVHEYVKNMKNGIIINEVNNSTKYIDALKTLINNKRLAKDIRDNGQETAMQYDFSKRVSEYIRFFEKDINDRHNSKTLSEKDFDIITMMIKEQNRHSQKITILNIAKKILPKALKIKIIELVKKIYLYYNS